MDLYIAEKPSLARTLAEHLAGGQKVETKKGFISGQDWVMTWCIGHLYQLYDADEYSDDWGSPWRVAALPIIPPKFKYRPVEKTVNQLKIVNSLLLKASRVFNCGDPDRVGNYLVDLVIEHSSYNSPVFRVWADDLSPSGLKKVFANIRPNSEYLPLSLSARCRAHADWLVGINFTRFYTCIAQEKGFQGTLSLGRVQTVAFSLVYNRCLEIENFIPLHHFGLKASISVANGTFTAEWLPPDELTNEQGYCLDRRQVERVYSMTKSREGTVRNIEIKNISESAPLPFSLSNLQIYCSRKWGYSAKQVLNASQYLYEDLKALTYPRTDCSYLSEGDFKDAALISNVSSTTIGIDLQYYSPNFNITPRCYNDAKTTAHTGIIPTSCPPNFNKFESLSSKEKKIKGISELVILENIYTSVTTRFIAQFLPKHVYQATTLITVINNHKFGSTGKIVKTVGWKILLADYSKINTDTILPITREGEPVCVMNQKINNKKTDSPEYFTEGTLIAALSNISKYVDDPEIRKKLRETDGIGTEATRADIIERIKSVGYIRPDGKKLLITTLGRDVFPFFPAFFKTAAMTAIWESALQGIAEARLDHTSFEHNIVNWTKTQINRLKETPPEINVNIDDKYRCRACESPLIRRKGKYGHYWRCTKRECSESYNEFKRAPLYPLKGDGDSCPKCQSCGRTGIMKTRVMKEKREKGLPAKIFLGCNQFPKCNQTEWEI